MQFDAGTWYIVATLISIMVIIIGVMITVISKFVVLNPMEALKKSIDILVATISDIKMFMELQKNHNEIYKTQFDEVYCEIDKMNEKLDNSANEISEHKHKLNNHLQNHVAMNYIEKEL